MATTTTKRKATPAKQPVGSTAKKEDQQVRAAVERFRSHMLNAFKTGAKLKDAYRALGRELVSYATAGTFTGPKGWEQARGMFTKALAQIIKVKEGDAERRKDRDRVRSGALYYVRLIAEQEPDTLRKLQAIGYALPKKAEPSSGASKGDPMERPMADVAKDAQGCLNAIVLRVQQETPDKDTIEALNACQKALQVIGARLREQKAERKAA